MVAELQRVDALGHGFATTRYHVQLRSTLGCRLCVDSPIRSGTLYVSFLHMLDCFRDCWVASDHPRRRPGKSQHRRPPRPSPQASASQLHAYTFLMARKAIAKDQIVKLIVGAGQASPSPPVGPALGSKGVKSMDFCKV
jgi:hypothetical protein